jgi:sulfotransferase 6B1
MSAKPILANALPKNGTHLLLKCLGEVPGYRFSGHEVDWGDPERALRLLRATAPGQFTKGHIPCFPEARAFVLSHPELRVFNMVRDPRDNLVSFFHYLLAQPNHPLHPHFAAMRDDHARLLACILGFADAEGRPVIRDIGWRLRNWVAWEQVPGVVHLRFERLVGPQGGGDAAAQLAEVEKILAALGINAEALSAEEIAARVFDRSVHSFRRGESGGWRRHFRAEHVEAFKEVANWALLHWGYETDADWRGLADCR